MSSSFVEQVTTALIRFQLPATSAIIAGVDSTNYAHIYSVQGTTSMCADHVGFASIGMGAWHANSQLMLARHDKLRPLEETLRLVYAAKKRSEVAPGVGRDTDMVVVGFPLGNFIRVEGKPLKSFQRIHENAEKAIQRVEDRAQRETKKYLDGLADQTQPKDQAGDAEAVSDPNKKAD